MPRQLSESEFTALQDQIIQSLPKGLSEDEFTRAFNPRFAAAIGEAENLPPKPEGSALERFAGGAAQVLNPMNLVSAALHPIDTAKNIIGGQVEQGTKAIDAAKAGHLPEAAWRGVAAVLPVVGPAAVHAGEQIASGDVAGGLGQAAGLLAPYGAKAALEARAGVGVPAKANILERQAEEQVAQKVLGPGNPAYKGKAAAIAPDVLARKLTGDRPALQEAAEQGMADAATKLDDAIQSAGGVKAPIAVSEVVNNLRGRIADLKDSKGQPLSSEAAKRIGAIQDRITQLQGLGGRQGIATFEDLRKIRDESYRLADEARGYQKMGNPSMSNEGWAARETGSAIREAFAKRSPASAAANADYSFWKSLSDVLDPVLGRPKATGLPVGVTGGARIGGAVVGQMVGPKMAFAMGAVVPWIRERLASPGWQLADAQSKMKLAKAIRDGDIGRAKSLMLQIERAAPVGATSQNESPAGSIPLPAGSQ